METVIEFDVQQQDKYHLFSNFFQAPAKEVKNDHSIVPIGRTQLSRNSREILSPQSKTAIKIASSDNLPLRYFANAPLFDGHRLYQTDSDDWVLMPIEDDPLFQYFKDKLYVPEKNIAEIEAVTNAGIDFDRIYIAHELPDNADFKDGRVSARSIAPAPSIIAQRQANQLNQQTNTLWKRTSQTVETMSKMVAGIATIAVGTAVAVVAAPATLTLGLAAGLDPILFGVNLTPDFTNEGQQIGEWFYITHWFWNEGENENA